MFYVLVDKNYKAGLLMARRIIDIGTHLFAFGPYKTGKEAMDVKRWWNNHIVGR